MQARCPSRLHQAIPSTHPRPIRVFSQDESRVGFLPVRRRRLTARGGQPIGAVHHGFEWCEVSGAVDPPPGDRFFLALPYLHTDIFPLGVDALAPAFPERLHLLLLDNSGAHAAQRLTVPEHVRLVCWPPYGPELNPIERVWRDRKDARAWLSLPTLEAQQDDLTSRLQADQAATLRTLTSYPSLGEARHALDS